MKWAFTKFFFIVINLTLFPQFHTFNALFPDYNGYLNSKSFRNFDIFMSSYGGGRGGGYKSSGGGSGGSYRGGSGGYRGGSGGRSFNRPPDFSPLRFTKTIKIDPESKTPLVDMPLSDRTKRVLTEKGFESMTPIQSQSYDLVYSGADVVARSRTGTGKTFAFGLPLIEKILANEEYMRRSGRNGLPLILILEPTRELAIQVAQELGLVCAAHRLRVEAIYGGSSFYSQEKAIRSGVHILVATPGRALDHISRRTVDLSGVEHVVLDEGDTMLEMGFAKDVENILANVKKPGEASRSAAQRALESSGDARGQYDNDEELFGESGEDSVDGMDPSIDASEDDDEFDENGARRVQMLLFSATMPGWICKLTDKHMKSPVFLDAVQEGETRLSASIKHYCIKMPRAGSRVEAISSIAEDLILTKGSGGQTIVFTNTKEEADNLFGSECFGKLRTNVLHGDISQNTRQATIKQFKEGQLEVLIATDVAARGLDIAGVDLVLHTAPPNDHDTYVHRSGRTGRAGRNGTAILLYSPSDEGKLRMFENQLNFRFEKTGPPTLSQISEASAQLASKKISMINDNTAKYFIPHAKSLIEQLSFEENGIENSDTTDGSVSPEKFETLLAKCLAAISNRNAITTRSLQTGESGLLTLHVEAVFKNGTSPDNTRDWQRLFVGVLKRSLNIDDLIVGKVSMGRGDNRIPCAVIDVPYEDGQTILTALQTIKLPQGLVIRECNVLPNLDREYSDRPSFGSRNYGGGGGGGYSDRGGRSSSGDRGSGSRSYNPTSRSSEGGPSWGRSGSGGGSGKTYNPSSDTRRTYVPTSRNH